MILSWRRRRSNHGGIIKGEVSKGFNTNLELTIPVHFQCPISLDLMKDPVTLSTGITYDRESIEKWIDAGNVKCPVTNQVLRNFDEIPNHALRKIIQDWCVKNKSCGVDRIPTPKIPITPYQVLEICSRMVAATQHGDARKVVELVVKIVICSKESERNKRCIVENGLGTALANSFEFFARVSVDTHMNLLKEILSAMTWAFPLSQEGISKLKSTFSLRCMALFLKGEDNFSSRQNVISVLKELILSDEGYIDGLMEIKGIEEILFQIVKVPICPQATKASLVVIHHMMSFPEKGGIITLRFIQMGLIPYILEILIDGDKSTCEKALTVLERICSCQEGKEKSRDNLLTIPLLIKKILRVSDVATESSILTLWKLCHGQNENENENENKNSLIEAVNLGVIQKLLVVLQVGCGETTREKITELLKLMNLCRNKVEDCFDSTMGFNYIRRST